MKKALDSNLDFDGMAGTGVNRAGNAYAGNQSGQKMKENFGRGPVKGNASSSPMKVGASATKDPHKMTIATASQGGRINGGTTVKGFANPDSINVGMK
jgi:hypothetical protein